MALAFASPRSRALLANRREQSPDRPLPYPLVGDHLYYHHCKTAQEKFDTSAILIDILGGEDEPLPEFLEIEEALILRAILPEERLPELEKAAKKFVDSISGEKPQKSADWLTFYFKSTPCSFDEKVGLFMMIMTAEIFVDWYTVLLVLRDSETILRKMIVKNMIPLAKSVRELSTVRIQAKELGIEIPEETE